MKPVLPSVLLMIAAASLLAGCGKGAGSSNAAAAPQTTASSSGGGGPATAGAPATPGADASAATDCTYISPAQISSIEGATYAAPTAFHSICTWIGSDGNPLSITLTRNANDAAWQDVLDTVQRDQASDPPTPIPGLGDRAAGTGLEIAVQKGSLIIDIRNGDSPGFGKWPKSTAIANAILAGPAGR